MIDIYKQADEIIKHLEKTFEDFELGDSIQVNEKYIYIELWIGSADRKVRHYYLGREYNSIEELEAEILLHILNMINDDVYSDPRLD